MPKVGDVISISYNGQGGWSGVVVEIETSQDLFSEKYAIMETNTYLHVLCDGEIKIFDADEHEIEVINAR
tara:strand:+ start:1364 stop:1573 length:210 start_codon:yes stop_codon:yes gene_type:complete